MDESDRNREKMREWEKSERGGQERDDRHKHEYEEELARVLETADEGALKICRAWHGVSFGRPGMAFAFVRDELEKAHIAIGAVTTQELVIFEKCDRCSTSMEGVDQSVGLSCERSVVSTITIKQGRKQVEPVRRPAWCPLSEASVLVKAGGEG